MCNSGTGVLLVTATNTLVYYAADIAKYLVSGGQNVAIVDYVTPNWATVQQIAIATAAGAATAATLICLRRFGPDLDTHFANVIDSTKAIIPGFARQPLLNAAAALNSGQYDARSQVYSKLDLSYSQKTYLLKNKPAVFQLFVNTRNLIIPAVVEEALFNTGRGVVGLAIEAAMQAALESNGVSSEAAKLLTVPICSALFAASHFTATQQTTWDKKRFANLFTAGVVFGVLMNFFGLKGAIVSHIAYNTVLNI